MAHVIQDVRPTAATVGKRMPSPIVTSRLFIIDTKELQEWEDLGPALPEMDVWPSNEKVIGSHRAVLTYATGTTLWVELNILNWQKDIRVQPCSSQTAFHSITKNNQYGY